MLVNLQRVRQASVEVNGAIVGAIDRGLVLYIAIDRSDITSQDQLQPTPIIQLAQRIPRMRLFPDSDSHFASDLHAVSGAALCISQFTLPGRTSKGTRPSFERAAKPDLARAGFDLFCDTLSEHVPVAKGVFAADMTIRSEQDGPITLWLGTSQAETPWLA